MNKIVAAVAAVVIIGGGIYFLTRQNKTAETDVKTVSQEMDMKQEGAQDQEKSFKELMTASTPQKCEVSFAVENGSSQGTVYIAKNKMRGDFTMQAAGQAMTGHMISDGEYMYNWTDGQKTAFKFKIDQKAAATTTGESFSVDQRVKYNCENWSEDGSVFNLPTEISFSEYGAMQTGSMGASESAGASGSAGSNQCAACNQLSGDAKNACKSALACPN